MSSSSRRSVLAAAGLAAGAVGAFATTGAATWQGLRALQRRAEISLAERDHSAVTAALAGALSQLPPAHRTRALRLAERAGLTPAPSPSPSAAGGATPNPAPTPLSPLSALEQAVVTTATPEARGRAIAWFCVLTASGGEDLSGVTLGSAVAEKGAWTPSGSEAGQAVAACDEAAYWAETLASRSEDSPRSDLLASAKRWADRASALRSLLPQSPPAPLGYPASRIDSAAEVLTESPQRVSRLLLAAAPEWPAAIPTPLLETTLLTLRELTG